MAVIDTSMDMPISCDICPNYQGENSHCLKGCFIPYRMFDVCDARHKDCPLKSADDMISREQIEKMVDELKRTCHLSAFEWAIIRKYTSRKEQQGEQE